MNTFLKKTANFIKILFVSPNIYTNIHSSWLLRLVMHSFMKKEVLLFDFIFVWIVVACVWYFCVCMATSEFSFLRIFILFCPAHTSYTILLDLKFGCRLRICIVYSCLNDSGHIVDAYWIAAVIDAVYCIQFHCRLWRNSITSI